MAAVHPHSVVDSRAEIAPDVEIGPFCTVGAGVKLGPGCKLISHVVIDGDTTVGSGNTFFPFCSIGLASQDKKYANEPTRVVIGDSNVFSRKLYRSSRHRTGSGAHLDRFPRAIHGLCPRRT